MPNERLNETMFSIDEDKKLVLGQRTVVEEFDVNEIQQQLNAREQGIEACEKQIKEFKEEIDKINKFKTYIEKWSKEFIEEQKKEVMAYQESIKKKEEKVVDKKVIKKSK